MLKFLRIAVTTLSLTACVLLIVLWVRSYMSEDRAQGHVNAVGIRFYSSRGWIVCFKNNDYAPGDYTWSLALGSDYWLAANDSRLGFTSPARFFSGSTTSNISMPHWLAVVFAASTGAIPWLRWRYSLRTLLIAMTLVAVAIGILAVSTNDTTQL